MRELDEVRAAIARRELAVARDVAIEWWRRAPAVELGELVDALDAHVDQAPAGKMISTQWLASARAATTNDERGRLLRALPRDQYDTVEMLKIAVAWRDPRVGRALIALCQALPWRGERSRKGWRAIFEVMRAHGDPRFPAAAAALAETWKVGDEMQRFLTARIAEAIEGIEEVRAPELAQLIEELRAKPSPEEESLLAEIYARPDDDHARLVYADWLQQRGDPRGELIAVQLAGDDSQAARQRAARLVRVCGRRLIGPLEPVVTGVGFRRGFPSTVTAKFRDERDVEMYGHHPAWATVEHITWAPSQARDARQLWCRTVTREMANLRSATEPSIATLVEHPRPRLERVSISTFEIDAEAFRVLLTSPQLPALRWVTAFHGGIDPTWLVGVTRCAPHLELTLGLDAGDRDRYLEAARSTGLETVTFTAHRVATYHACFSRDAGGELSRLEVALAIRASRDQLAAVGMGFDEELRQLRLRHRMFDPLTHFDVTVEVDGERVSITHLLTQRHHVPLRADPADLDR